MMDNIVVTTGLVILFIAIQYICLKDFQFSFWGTFSASILFVVLYIVLIILHETSHLIGFMLFGGVPFKSLKYGVNLELGVAYATTDQPLPNHAMKKSIVATILDNWYLTDNCRILFQQYCVATSWCFF